MRIKYKAYERAQGERLCCIQCGRTCRTRTGNVVRIYFRIIKQDLAPKGVVHTDVYQHYKAPMIICRLCFLRRGGLRQNAIGGIRLYDSLSGQPYGKYGDIPIWDNYTDIWKDSE